MFGIDLRSIKTPGIDFFQTRDKELGGGGLGRMHMYCNAVMHHLDLDSLLIIPRRQSPSSSGRQRKVIIATFTLVTCILGGQDAVRTQEFGPCVY